MNIRNVAMLAEMLKELGFEKAGYELLKRISFRPERFVIKQRLQKGDDSVLFQISFEKREDTYHFKYYDAALRKAIDIPEQLSTLDTKMEAVDWSKAFAISENGVWNAEDPLTWKTEAQVSAIITEIEALEDQDVAGRLKVKYWSDVEQDIFNLQSLRSKYEITQRFYFFEGQGCIGAEEAYRFLHNRWMEKQMLAKRKVAADSTAEPAGSKGSLLPKKKGSRKKLIT
jgi:hypothetical protein